LGAPETWAIGGPLDGFIFGIAEALAFAFLTRSEALLFTGERIFEVKDALSLKQPVPMFHCCLPVWRSARISVSESGRGWPKLASAVAEWSQPVAFPWHFP